MAISNFKVGNRKDDIKLLTMIIISFLLVIWLCSPPGNKFIQLCFYGHNIQYQLMKIVNKDSIEEYLFYWKNAKYLVMMGDKKAVYEMDKAVQLAPSALPNDILEQLYKDRANINLYFKNYKAALDDYLRVEKLTSKDLLKVAFLFKEQGKQAMAVSYCNRLFSMELERDNACACVADIYASVGKYNSSIKVFDYLIAKNPNKPEYYIERSNYKKLAGDFYGQRVDIRKAQSIKPDIDLELPKITDVMLPEQIELSKVF